MERESAREDRNDVATHLSAKNVAGGPRLREGQAMGLVCVLALKLAVDRTRGCKRMIVSLMHWTREERAEQEKYAQTHQQPGIPRRGTGRRSRSWS